MQSDATRFQNFGNSDAWSADARKLFAGQAYLLLHRCLRGLSCDPRSLRSLSDLALQLADMEDRTVR